MFLCYNILIHKPALLFFVSFFRKKQDQMKNMIQYFYFSKMTLFISCVVYSYLFFSLSDFHSSGTAVF